MDQRGGRVGTFVQGAVDAAANRCEHSPPTHWGRHHAHHWCLTFGALFGRSAPGPALADTLAVCTEASPDALNAQLSTANTSFDVSEQIADRLVEMKIGGSDLVPGLASPGPSRKMA